jgi:hypothetical protein
MAGSQPLTYQLTYRSNARRITARVRQGVIYISAPKRTSKKEIEDFLRQYQSFFENALTKSKERSLKNMKRVLIAGKEMDIVQTSQSSYIDEKEGRLYLGQDAEQLKRVLKEAAVPYIEAKVQAVANRLHLPVPALHYGFYKSKWGSYSRTKHVMAFNLSMLFLPPDLLEHVVCHEFAHISVFDHSPAFYARLLEIEPQCKEREKRLKEIRIPEL